MMAWLIETLIASTVLMLLVLLLRQPVRQSFGAHAAYALWLLPALRMILPPLGALFPAAAPINPVNQASGAVGALVRAQFDAGLGALAMAAPTLEVTPTASTGSIWLGLAAGLWLLGLVVFLVFQWFAYRRFCGAILSEATLRDELSSGIKLLSSPHASGPMAFGLRQRFVVFPADADRRFDEEERAMALAHELAHHQRGDLIANTVALAILALHWCNPVAWFAYRAFRADQELACDADVIAQVRGSGLGHAYGRALVKCASGREFAAVCNLTTVDRLKRRLAMLSTKSPSNRRRWTGFLLTGSVVISGLVLTASGESMAAKVGARVSAELPIPQVSSALPSLPAAPGVLSRLGIAPAHAVDAQEERIERLADAMAGDVPPVPAVPPVPPAPRVAGVPPMPPVPPVPPVPAVPAVPALPPFPAAPPVPAVEGAGSHQVYVMKHDEIDRERAEADRARAEADRARAEANRVRAAGDRARAESDRARAAGDRARAQADRARALAMTSGDGKHRTVIVRNIRADGDDKDVRWEELVPDVVVQNGKNCDANAVKTTEDSVTINGVQRKRVMVTVCEQAYAQKAREEAAKSMKAARDGLAAASELNADLRTRLLADLDRQIARLKSEHLH